MDVKKFIDVIEEYGVGFYTGVPDSQLKALCDYLINDYGISKKHIIAANEGNAVALASGYYMSTGKLPCVYLQNSGLGNIVNPVTSLMHKKVYGIPCIFIIGWRGEPNTHDEPQHLFQGQITLECLELLDIEHFVIDSQTTEQDIKKIMIYFKTSLSQGKSVAFVVKNQGLSCRENVKYKNDNVFFREDIISTLIEKFKQDIIISTTGKTSRELFELREQYGQSHKYDFLTVGSMGHSSSIALGVALNKPNTRVWCIDGDGAALMHLGALAIIGQMSPINFYHIIINNQAHESVGGQPTAANIVDFQHIAKGCGYRNSYKINDKAQLTALLNNIDQMQGPILIEVKSAIGSRENLGRPTTNPEDNKSFFMKYLQECD